MTYHLVRVLLAVDHDLADSQYPNLSRSDSQLGWPAGQNTCTSFSADKCTEPDT